MKRWKKEFDKEFKSHEDGVTKGIAEFFYEAGWTRAIIAMEERLKQDERKVDDERI
jgi:hypothetical protein